MTVAVYGAGAIGGLVAARLAEHDDGVVLLCRTAEQAGVIAREGLHLVTPTGTVTVPVAATTATTATVDTAFVAVKAFALAPLLETGALHNARTVIPLLNGLEHPSILRRAVADADVRVGAIYAQATRTAANVIEQQSGAARIALGPFTGDGGGDALTTALTAAGFGVEVADEQQVLWDKFARVCWAATLCSVSRTTVGEARVAMFDDADALVRELAAVANADGVPMDVGRLRAAMWALPSTLEPSMVRDVRAGGASELNAITGALIRRARSLAVGVPVTERMYARLARLKPPPEVQWST